MRINTNIGALSAAGNLSRVNDAVRSSTEKLSSGFRINKAADDAAGLGVANFFRADIRALTQAQRNAEQAASVFQIAEGGAGSIEKILERMKELAAQAASDSVDTDGRSRIDTEFQSLINEINRVTETTEFQGQRLLAGTYGALSTTGTLATNGSITSFKTNGEARTVTFTTDGLSVTATDGAGITQVLTKTTATASSLDFTALGVKITTSNAADATVTTDLHNKTVITTAGSGTFLIGASRQAGAAGYKSVNQNLLQIQGSDLALTAASLKLGTGFARKCTTLAEAQTSLAAVDTALSLVNQALGAIGAGQNRLANAIDNIKSTVLNYAAAESTIRDLDMAAEMVTFSKNQIIAQAGMAMLAQANQSSQSVLKLLQ